MGSYQRSTTVAIVGGGPGGLATAIALSELSDVSVTLYEQNPEPREVGAGLSIGDNGWKVLELLGAADGIRGCTKSNATHRLATSHEQVGFMIVEDCNASLGSRNGYTGEVFLPAPQPDPTVSTSKRARTRVRRARLQSALLARIPPGIIQYNKKLVSLRDLDKKGAHLTFQDGTQALVDLVVGADGFRSIVRRTLFPDHQLHFIGARTWRTLVPISSAVPIGDLMGAWHGTTTQAFFSGVDDESDEDLFEISLRASDKLSRPDPAVSWGVPVTNDKVTSNFTEFDPRVRAAIALVPEGQWREFALFAGPCLEDITAWDKVALIGDASHPLSGGFGTGSAFAMEDAWILARALEHTRNSSDRVKDALKIFDEIRSPYYKRIYHWRESQPSMSAAKRARVESENRPLEDILRDRLRHFFPDMAGHLDWIHKNDIGQVWKAYVESSKGIDLG
ncbi:hypothetical protein A1O3_00418 [Capronia epimyces CBS 606.96]|uniref:FAD-binding domain-containing protein n=1 Tax=Capronia epimyces CBS 606.96 TaxID=1182542 RepID=W9YH71_9EURO|nr:uncharacterized protein A1O3_00418 [Capronia epimyces CBS 606.96]EXJ91868.1 hypothetical protein A1O3_00418 [Capronia epimyces CBS 606.96]